MVNLSSQDNAKLLEQLKSNFKRIINCNNYQSNVEQLPRNSYLNQLNGPYFHGVNRIFVLSFENLCYDFKPIKSFIKSHENLPRR